MMEVSHVSLKQVWHEKTHDWNHDQVSSLFGDQVADHWCHRQVPCQQEPQRWGIDHEI